MARPPASKGEHLTVPEYTLSVPILGNRWMVGVVFLLHISAVAFIIGVAMIAPVAEIVGLRTDEERWERLAHQIASAIERLFSWGATWAAFSLVAIWGLFPRLWGFLSSLFMIQEMIMGVFLWLLMTVSAYLYYLTWEPLRHRRVLHNAIGWVFVISTMVFISLIVGLSSYQLTPAGSPSNLLAAAFNPSYPTEVAHRHIGNLSYGGLLLAGYVGGWFLLFRGRREVDPGNRSYHDWVGDVAMLMGLGVMLLQPIGGWLYVRQIQNASPGAWERMMPGENGWLFLIQIGLLGIMFLLGNLYLYLGTRRSEQRGPVSWMKISLWLVVVLALLAVIPKELPLGQMKPWKYISLAGFLIVTAVNLVLYIRRRHGFTWDLTHWQTRAVMAAGGVTIVALILLMGIIRESARGSDLIYRQMGPGVSQEIERP